MPVVGRVKRMGIDRAGPTEAVTSAGFDVEMTREWPGWDYLWAVFMKLGATKPSTSWTALDLRLAGATVLGRGSPARRCAGGVMRA